MNWWQQMPWIVALTALLFGPFIAGVAAMVIRRIEAMDERSTLVADAELLDKFPDYEASNLLRKLLDDRLTEYVRNMYVRRVKPLPLTRKQKIYIGILCAISIIGIALGSYVVLGKIDGAQRVEDVPWPAALIALVGGALNLLQAPFTVRGFGRSNGNKAEIARHKEAKQQARETDQAHAENSEAPVAGDDTVSDHDSSESQPAR
ncbi:hypothetical protein QM716_10285 [Rhodococcus sp. IEGM 1409]|uniref:hypothetical protein n=1 Tax=Rhodococcus sp. IEGM 1409 TaxID=3047082 RepID=UPI0024B684B6|nr:hypothetical protein [Rhodococcus sp. IEGM 1409]MDI9900242.1 hypothetical protein [Rhodococcus sp. IEGM 1409]